MKIKSIKNLFRKKKIFHREKLIVVSILFFAISFRLVFEIFPGNADASWYDADWKYRQKITLNNSQIVGNESSFPLLVNTTQNALKSIWSGGRMGKVNAGDLLFTAADGTTKLNHEIEKYVFNTGELVAFVKIPQINTTGDQFIYMYYGNENALDQWDTSGAVWTDRYESVYHLNDNCDTASCVNDFANSNNATPYNGDTVASLYENIGKIGPAFELDGDNDYIKIPYTEDFDFTSDFTIEAYAQLNELSRYSSILDKGPFSLKVGPDKRYVGNMVYEAVSSTEEYDTAYSFGTGYVVTSLAEFKGELFVTVEGDSSSSSSLYKSSDGSSFSLVNSYGTEVKIGGLSVFKDNIFFFADNVVYASSNGTSWNTAYSASENISSMVVYSNYLYIGTSASGLLYRSLIGTSSWSLVKDFATNEIIDVKTMTVYGGDLFAGGEGGKLMISTNGTYFSVDEDFGATSIITALGVFDGKLFVGISNESTSGGNSYYRNYAGTYTQSNFPEY
ncbi:MAG: DUF2341 domain-containing protein [Candidatus Gracilibacteria bacterium]|jgi:hypothetical protein|nr:DUF2341 domain-containing protein [Candidatus Gracilibacteria bacterium]